ncbi:MAG: hypothetical protein AAFX92_06120 [Pseudomonadota bacterium]
MSLTAAPEWFFANRSRFPIQPVQTNKTYVNVSGTIEFGLPFVAPATNARAMSICLSSTDAANRRVTGISWGAAFGLEREANYQRASPQTFLHNQLWRAEVPAVHGDSADFVLTLSGSGSIDRLCLTVFGTTDLDSILAVDDGESDGTGFSRTMFNIATTAEGLAIGSIAILDGSGSVSGASGNLSTGSMIVADQSSAFELSHAAFYGPTPATDTIEDFTASYTPAAPSASTIATFK